MLPKTLIRGFDKRRLRNLLALFFLALAVPTAVLIVQAYGQLKWEAFHQHRGAAEELTRRIDTSLNELVRTADGRSFADYSFLIVSGDPSANLLQRSPLSAYPVLQDLPGAMGYFQVDTAGTFSTPLLPAPGAEFASLGISEDEFAGRQQVAQGLQAVLADNHLVQARPDLGVRRGIATPFAVGGADLGEEEAEQRAYRGSGDGRITAEKDVEGAVAAAPTSQIAAANENYSQQIFDQLNQPRSDTGVSSSVNVTLDDYAGAGEAANLRQGADRIGKVSELKLDAALQKKSEEVEDAKEQTDDGDSSYAPGRAKRRERIALPESPPVATDELRTNATQATGLRINTFESEIDPFEFSLLDSGHFVLFRRVWRDGERYIQGLLLDQKAFIGDIIGAQFEDTSLSNMSSLIVAFQDNVIHSFSGRDSSSYPDVAEDLDGALLYRSRLTAPLNDLELIFSINRLPPGAGASVLGWVTLVLAVVFAGGFFRCGICRCVPAAEM